MICFVICCAEAEPPGWSCAKKGVHAHRPDQSKGLSSVQCSLLMWTDYRSKHVRSVLGRWRAWSTRQSHVWIDAILEPTVLLFDWHVIARHLRAFSNNDQLPT